MQVIIGGIVISTHPVELTVGLATQIGVSDKIIITDVGQTIQKHEKLSNEVCDYSIECYSAIK